MPRRVFRPAAVIKSDFYSLFPQLIGSKWSIRSPFHEKYQCIAWAACRTDIRWWPVETEPDNRIVEWPPGAPFDDSVENFIRAFARLGYERCFNADFELGYQKVAIYATSDARVTHMARQSLIGRGWLSKCGNLEDIRHDYLSSIEGDPSALMAPITGSYGHGTSCIKAQYLARRYTSLHLSRYVGPACLLVISNFSSVMGCLTLPLSSTLARERARALPVVSASRLTAGFSCGYSVQPSRGSPAALQNAHHDRFVFAAGPGDSTLAFAQMHVPGFATDESFVNLALARKLLMRCHSEREPDSVIHEPPGFLSHSDGPMNLVTANAVLAVHYLPHSDKPFIQTERRVFKNGPGFCGEVP